MFVCLILTVDQSPSIHQQLPSTQYDGYNSPPPPQPQYDLYSAPQAPAQYQEPGFSSETNNALLAAGGLATHPSNHYSNPYHSQPAPAPVQQFDRSYSLGGQGYNSGYGGSQTVDHTQYNNQYFSSPYENQPPPGSPPQLSSSPAPINTNVAVMPLSNTSPVKGPRTIGSPVHQYSDSPPGYENGPSRPPGAWGDKR